MNVARLSMSPERAEAKLEAVRRVLAHRADPEYEQLEHAYAAAAEGLTLIQLSQAIQLAPRDEKGRPRLAIARADRRRVRVNVNGRRGVCEFNTRTSSIGSWSAQTTNLVIDVEWPHAGPGVDGYGIVPMVPPDILEEIQPRSDLRKYHILFEVEQWADSPMGARPDIDPYLLRHVQGDLWAVIAEWDLTDIERAVMAARARD